jgi:hypothetical protein
MIVVYTAIIGGCDSLKPAPVGADNCYCFSDDPAMYEGIDGRVLGWRVVGAGDWSDPRREAWHLRCVPHELFPRADTTIWMDASFTMTNLPKLLKDSAGHELAALRHHGRTTVTAEGAAVVKAGQATQDEVDTQLSAYRAEGFGMIPLSVSCILVRQNTPKVTAFNNLWDSEIKKYPGDNTQLSLDYAAWKSGLFWHALKGGRLDNPYAVHDRADHKARRKPYR